MNGRCRDILLHVPPNPVVAEIGVADCELSLALLEGHERLRLHLVDPFIEWMPEDYPYPLRAGRSKERASRQLRRALILCQSYRRCELHPVHSNEVVTDVKFDLVFIDADHSYESVKEDIEVWLPRVKKGGYLSGHDYGPPWEGVIKAVDELGNFTRGIHDTSTWFYKVQ